MQQFSYESQKWRNTREKVLRRDGYLCTECKRYGRLRKASVVHHIKHVDEFPELAWDMTNMTSLCMACHNAQHPEKAVKRNKMTRPRYEWNE